MPNATSSELYYIIFFLAYQFQLQTASDVIRVKTALEQALTITGLDAKFNSY